MIFIRGGLNYAETEEEWGISKQDRPCRIERLMGSGETLGFLVYPEVQLCPMRGRFQAAEKAGRTENQATRADRRCPSRRGIAREPRPMSRRRLSYPSRCPRPARAAHQS